MLNYKVTHQPDPPHPTTRDLGICKTRDEADQLINDQYRITPYGRYLVTPFIPSNPPQGDTTMATYLITATLAEGPFLDTQDGVEQQSVAIIHGGTPRSAKEAAVDLVDRSWNQGGDIDIEITWSDNRGYQSTIYGPLVITITPLDLAPYAGRP